ncbi:hypothetical protein [Arthrobacter pascens]|uniref:hypothetical protein n=1 Tax=Arthrobacter pascens TaxID=1677 RepID=UPI0027D7CC35|nr:hypothetical protein [Arthrobacter pascens]
MGRWSEEKVIGTAPDQSSLAAARKLARPGPWSDTGSNDDSNHAAALAGIGVPAFACTPDLFPELMAAAIERRDVSEWAAFHDIVTTHET